MPKAVIVVEFQNEAELTEKLDLVGYELHGDIFDRLLYLPPGTLWEGDDYSLYLVPDGFKLSAENENEFYGLEESERESTS